MTHYTTVQGSAGHAPLRRANSIRRTMTLDSHWPGGRDEHTHISGRARDVFTGDAAQPPRVLAEDAIEAEIKMDRTITALSSDPPRPALAELVGMRGGGHLRGALKRVVPRELEEAAPFYLLLDDLSGMSLIGRFAWSRWADVEAEAPPPQRPPGGPTEGVCHSFRQDSPVFEQMRAAGRQIHDTKVVLDLRHPEDPEGWHRFFVHDGPSMRRARRIDLWRSATHIEINAAFQDSSTLPDGRRMAVHEYTLSAKADLKTGELSSIEAIPHVLPFGECPGAVANIQRLVGAPISELRTIVLERLAKTAGCTHLNDAMRALAEAPTLVAKLPVSRDAAAGAA
jgi:hypothetical protein